MQWEPLSGSAYAQCGGKKTWKNDAERHRAQNPQKIGHYGLLYK